MYILPATSINVDPKALFTLPVHYSSAAPLDPVFAPLAGKSDVRISLLRASHAAARYLHAERRTDATGQEVSNFRFTMLLDLDTYFEFDLAAPDPEIVKKSKSTNRQTAEHGKFASERLAYGVTLLFIKRYWPAIRLSDVRFIPGTGGRPDFLLPVLGPKGGRLAAEAKSDSYRGRLTPSALKALRNKKHGYEAVICVYFHHGKRFRNRLRGARRTGRTRIIVADPNGDFEVAPPLDSQLAALERYRGRAFEIGLHLYVQRLDEAIVAHTAGVPLPGPLAGPFVERRLRHPQRRIYAGEMYIGRVFSSLLSQMRTDHAQALIALERSDFGLYSFIGLHRAVLRAIHEARWEDLVTFSVGAEDDALPGTLLLYQEGFVVDSVVAEPGSSEAAEIMASL